MISRLLVNWRQHQSQPAWFVPRRKGLAAELPLAEVRFGLAVSSVGLEM